MRQYWHAGMDTGAFLLVVMCIYRFCQVHNGRGEQYNHGINYSLEVIKDQLLSLTSHMGQSSPI